MHRKGRIENVHVVLGAAACCGKWEFMVPFLFQACVMGWSCAETPFPSCPQLLTFPPDTLSRANRDEQLSQRDALELVKVTFGTSAEGKSVATLFHVQRSAPFSVKPVVHLLLSQSLMSLAAAVL